MIENLKEFIKKVYPQNYIKLLEDNLQRRVFINEAKEIFNRSIKNNYIFYEGFLKEV